MAQGSIFMSGDRGPVLGLDGHRELVIRPAPNSEKDMPEYVAKTFWASKAPISEIELHGTYEACPVPEQPSQYPLGYLHYACINSASDLKLVPPIPKRK